MKHSDSRKHRPRRRKVFAYVFPGIIGLATAWILLDHALAKNRILDLGRRQRVAEQEIGLIEQDIRGVNLRIEEALSRQNLMEKLAARRTRLRPIQPGALVILSAPGESGP